VATGQLHQPCAYRGAKICPFPFENDFTIPERLRVFAQMLRTSLRVFMKQVKFAGSLPRVSCVYFTFSV